MSLLGGGRLDALFADLTDPLTAGTARVTSGRAPGSPKEAAVSPELADELGVVDAHGVPRDGAVLQTLRGEFRVVGVVQPGQGSSSLVVFGPSPHASTFLVDLPKTGAALRPLVEQWEAAGVAAWVRDATVHPELWTEDGSDRAVLDPTAAAVAAIIIGVGVVEIVVLVGAVFSIASRRQSRALGLVAASGGSPGDIRRIVVAHGVIVGGLASGLGVVAGVAALLAPRGQWEIWSNRLISSYDYPTPTIVATAALGLGSAVAAASLPALGAGRRSAWEMLDGNAGSSMARRRRRDPTALGVILVLLGALGTMASGEWIADEYHDPSQAPDILSLYAAGACLVVLLGGCLLALPWLVDAIARRVSRGWLSWRLATREAARQRARTVAGVAAIGVVAAGALFASQATAADPAPSPASQRTAPENAAVLTVHRDDVEDARALAALVHTVTDVSGATETLALRRLHHDGADVVTETGEQVTVADTVVRSIADLPPSAVTALRAGRVVVNSYATEGYQPGSHVTLEARPPAGPSFRRSLAVESVDFGFATSTSAWISPETAECLGLTAEPDGELWVRGAVPISQAELDRLAVYGIQGYIDEPGFHATRNVLWYGVAGVLALSAVVTALIVLLAAAEGQRDAATLTAIGAAPRTQRAKAGCQALFLGAVGAVLGVLLALGARTSLLRITTVGDFSGDWWRMAAIALVIPVFSGLVGWVVSPVRPFPVRRPD